MAYEDRIGVDKLIGKTLISATGAVGDEEMLFVDSEGCLWRMFHEQDCCEGVAIEDICGDLADLVESPITQAEESASKEHLPGHDADEYEESFTWTFYRFATAKGSVVVRWYGSSNGYYSEGVECERTKI